MATQHNYAAFVVPAPLISGFLYGLNNDDRVELRVNSVHNVDTDDTEPGVPDFGNGGPVHKCIVTIGPRDFLLYSWNVSTGQGIARNKSLTKIRPSTLFFGEVLVFPKGATAQVPFLKNALAIPKGLVEEAVGGYITAIMNARDANRAPPTNLKLTL